MSTPQIVPQCSPRAAYLAQEADIDAAVRRVLHGDRYVLGPAVASFESEFAAFIGSAHALGVANGTDALELALRALGVGEGDSVVTVAHTASATAVAIRATGAVPIFVDVDDDQGLIDPDAVEEVLTLSQSGRLQSAASRIRAIVPVHLYGSCVNMERLLSITRRFEVAIVEDCAQAHGAAISGRRIGTFGSMGSFSFYPTKNLGAIGDGGAIVTSEAELFERSRLLREYGWRERYVSAVEGTNSRLDELQAAILLVKLTKLDSDNARRRQIAAEYRRRIDDSRIRLPAAVDDERHVYHQFAIRCRNRDGLQRHLKGVGVGTLVHYPCPVHMQPAYSSAQYAPLPLPNTERWAREVLSLPMFPQLEQRDVDYVCDAVNSWDGAA